jgi:hypothetical protein
MIESNLTRQTDPATVVREAPPVQSNLEQADR